MTPDGWFKIDPSYLSFGVANQGSWYSKSWQEGFGVPRGPGVSSRTRAIPR